MGVLRVMWLALVAVTRGWRHVLGAYVWNLVLAACLGALVYGALAGSFGTSLAGERMRSGFDPFWYNSYAAQATGVAATFRPSVNGMGAVLDAADLFLDGFLFLLFGPSTGIVPLALVYLISWSFLSGGFIATFAGTAPPGGFLASACRHFPSILIVTAVGVVFFGIVLGPVRFWLDESIAGALRETIDERVRFAWVLAEFAALWLIIWAGKLVTDYAKVAVVLRGGGGRIGAAMSGLWRGLRLVARHPLRTGGIYFCTGVLWLGTLVVYVAIAPGTGVSSAAAILGMFVLGQVYVLSRVYMRATFYAGATLMYGALQGAAEPLPPSDPS